MREELKVWTPLGFPRTCELAPESPGSLRLEPLPSVVLVAEPGGWGLTAVVEQQGAALLVGSETSWMHVGNRVLISSSPQCPGLAAHSTPSPCDLASEVVTRWPSIAGAV